jgi:hypothetical protein
MNNYVKHKSKFYLIKEGGGSDDLAEPFNKTFMVWGSMQVRGTN